MKGKPTIADLEADGRIAPGFEDRAARRRAAETVWQELKTAARRIGSVEVVSGAEQQMRISRERGGEVKLWRKGDRFAIAFEGKVIGDYDPDEIITALMAVDSAAPDVA